MSNQGAIDSDFDENLRDAREALEDAIEGIQTKPMAGGVALDLVTRQPLFVRRVVADSLVEYYEAEGFDLLSYGVHPYLPVSIDDRVFECVYLSDMTVESLDSFGESKTYDFPEGRLAHAPIEQSWKGGED